MLSKGPFLFIDIVPIAGEPLELVRQTIEAALEIDFQNKRVYILDDKEDEEIKKLAENSGCSYFARKDTQVNTKAKEHQFHFF